MGLGSIAATLGKGTRVSDISGDISGTSQGQTGTLQFPVSAKIDAYGMIIIRSVNSVSNNQLKGDGNTMECTELILFCFPFFSLFLKKNISC